MVTPRPEDRICVCIFLGNNFLGMTLLSGVMVFAYLSPWLNVILYDVSFYDFPAFFSYIRSFQFSALIF